MLLKSIQLNQDNRKASKHVNNRFGRLRGIFSGKNKSRCRPYSEIACIYDHVMRHVDYSAWADYIQSVFKLYKPGVRTVLELACGTGNMSVELCRRGYSVTCSDISPAMLNIASEKFSREGMPVSVVAADMAALPFSRKFDAVLCLYDSINYLTKKKEFREAVGETASILAHSGLFIFDICTVKNSEMFFSDSTMVEVFGDITCQRICRFDSRKRIQENHFIIVQTGGKKVAESHFQKIYRLDEITQMFKDAPFAELGRFNDLSFETGTENSERVHFVFQRI